MVLSLVVLFGLSDEPKQGLSWSTPSISFWPILASVVPYRQQTLRSPSYSKGVEASSVSPLGQPPSNLSPCRPSSFSYRASTSAFLDLLRLLLPASSASSGCEMFECPRLQLRPVILLLLPERNLHLFNHVALSQLLPPIALPRISLAHRRIAWTTLVRSCLRDQSDQGDLLRPLSFASRYAGTRSFHPGFWVMSMLDRGMVSSDTRSMCFNANL